MKKVLFVLAAMIVAMSFSSCKFEKSSITVKVIDQDSLPVAARNVYYDDLAIAIIDAALPSPDEPLRDDEGREIAHQKTNASGETTIEVTLGVDKMPYFFYVFDEGTDKWVSTILDVKRGQHHDLTIKVNQ
ncbi:MAG: hypothetical protein J6T80_00170 [Paludibacteraceae bacterium]|nr:hypothetical protein [Paludibacteraceae bacterium]